MVGFDKGYCYAVGVGYLRRYVHGKGVNPCFIYIEHMDDKICSALGAVDWAVFPRRG